jgi:hypothetical protein
VPATTYQEYIFYLGPATSQEQLPEVALQDNYNPADQTIPLGAVRPVQSPASDNLFLDKILQVS